MFIILWDDNTTTEPDFPNIFAFYRYESGLTAWVFDVLGINVVIWELLFQLSLEENNTGLELASSHRSLFLLHQSSQNCWSLYLFSGKGKSLVLLVAG